jgi:adenylate cyclase class IV
MIEVEKRALLDKESYVSVFDALVQRGAVDKGKKDTETLFFISSDWQMKVQRSVKDHTAKIAWKSEGSNGAEARQEIELPIGYEDTEVASKLLAKLVPQAEQYPTVQQRDDFELDGILVSLKYSDDWGYHIEFDKVVRTKKGVERALEEITTLAQKLDVTLLTPEEETAFVKRKMKEAKKN